MQHQTKVPNLPEIVRNYDAHYKIKIALSQSHKYET